VQLNSRKIVILEDELGKEKPINGIVVDFYFISKQLLKKLLFGHGQRQ